MSNNRFMDALAQKKYLVADGATGSTLIQRGLPYGTSAEEWVLNNPDAIRKLHKDFLKAGADIILTCTFGASRLRLEAYGLTDRFEEINRTAANLARTAADEYGALVAASLGPLGQKLKPAGLLKENEAQRYYQEQAEILSKSGVDLLLIETQYDLTEAIAAVRGVKAVSDLPLIVSFSFDRGTQSMLGIGPSKFAEAMESMDLAGLGINCGKSLEDNLKALKELANHTHLPIWFKPNAGLPEINEKGLPIYSVTADMMGSYVPDWIDSGARIMGGCCGTSPAHLKAIADQVKQANIK
jgi:5-methyltetrahydrofolate--homocysteine methyltransferase